MTRVTMKQTQILDPMFREGVTMSNQFFSKDPAKAIIEIKEHTYERLEIMRSIIKGAAKDEYGYIDEFDIAVGSEIRFLEDLLDKIERSL